MTREFGVRWLHQSGRTWIAAGFTEQGAANTVANVADWPAYDAEIVVRDVGEWVAFVSAAAGSPVVSGQDR